MTMQNSKFLDKLPDHSGSFSLNKQSESPKNSPTIQLLKKKKKPILFLACILLFSTFLNIWGIKWGLPSEERIKLLPELSIVELLSESSQLIDDETKSLVGHKRPQETLQSITRRFLLYTHHPDEQLSLMAIARMDPSELDFHPHFYVYGGAFLYPLALSFKVASFLGYLRLDRSLEYFLTHPEEISRFYVVGRFMVVVSTLWAIIAIYFVSSSIGNRKTGLLASLLFAILPSTVIWTHAMQPHIYSVFLALFSLYYALKVLKEGRAKNYFFAGVFAGLATGSAINYAMIVIPSFLASILCPTENKEEKLKNGLVFSLSFLVSFFIPNYYYLLSPQEVLSYFGTLSGLWEFTPTLRAWSNCLYSIKQLLGFPVSLLMMAGFLYSVGMAVGRKDKVHLLLSITLVVVFLLVGSIVGSRPTYLGALRFGLLLIAILVIVASQFIGDVLKIVQIKKAKFFITILIVGVFFITLVKTIVYNLNFYRDATPKSTRIVAGEWINSHIPPGSSIRLHSAPAPFNSPPFKFNKYRLVLDSSIKADYVITSYSPLLDNLLDENSNESEYILLKSFEPIRSLFGIDIEPFYFANHRVSIFIRKDLYPKKGKITHLEERE